MNEPINTQQPPQNAEPTNNQGDQPSTDSKSTPVLDGKNIDPQELQQRYLEAVARQEAQTYQLSQAKRQLEQQLQEMQQRMESWKTDPVKALHELGVDPSVVVDHILQGDQPPKVESEVTALKQEIASLKEQLQGRIKTEEQREKEAQERAFFSEIGNKVREIAESREDFKDLKLALAIERDLFGQEPDLAALVAQPYKEAQQTYGRGLTPDELAAKLKDKAAEVVNRIRNSETIKAIIGAPQPNQQTQTPPGGGVDGIGAQSAQPKNPAEMTQQEWIEYVRARARK